MSPALPPGFKPVVVAFACEPGRGSEPGTGWGFVDELSRRGPVWVLTHTLHQRAIEAYMPTHAGHPIHWRYVELPPPLRWMWGPEMAINVYYYLWQRYARLALRRWHKQENFSLAHHVTYTRFWFPSAGAVLGIPFVWGPVGGGAPVPRQFRGDFSRKLRAVEKARSGLRRLAARDPGLKLTARRASVALATCADVVDYLKQLGPRRVEVMSATALPLGLLDDVREANRPPDDGLFRFVFVGRVTHWKGVQFALQAFAQVTNLAPHARFRIVGDGPFGDRIRALVRELKLDHVVEQPGYPAHAECVRQLAQGHVLVHAALRDSAGVVAEGLRLHKPVLCTALGTPEVLIDDSCGTVVGAENPEQLVADLRAAMLQLASDPAAYARKAEGAAKRDLEVSREARGERVLQLYAEALSDGG